MASLHPGSPPAAPPEISSRILSLKFMQRHRAEQSALPTRGESQPQPRPGGQAEPTARGSEADAPAKWRLALPAALRAADAPPIVVREPAALSGPEALLRFKPGRRSFGQFNQKLEKRLAAIGQTKREVAEEMARARADEARRAQQAAEYREMKARADASEEVEKRTGVSEEEMARRYAKYVPKALKRAPADALPTAATSELDVPPEVARPIRVMDSPMDLSSSGGKRKGAMQMPVSGNAPKGAAPKFNKRKRRPE